MQIYTMVMTMVNQLFGLGRKDFQKALETEGGVNSVPYK